MAVIKLFVLIDNFVARQIGCGYISGTFYCLCFNFIAIGYIVASDILSVQFVYFNISLGLDISVNRTALYALVTNNITVYGAVSYNVSINLHRKILRSVVAIMWECNFDWRFIRRKSRRNL